MKIGINARFLIHPYTGIGQYTYSLIRALAKIDKENEYFLFTPELVDLNLPDKFRQIRVPEKEYKSPSLRKTHWEHVLIPQEIKKSRADLAHFLYPSNPNFSLGIPTIVTLHDVIPWVLPKYRQKIRSRAYNMYARFALKKAGHIISVSEFTKKEAKKILKIPEKDITVTHLAASADKEINKTHSDLPLRRQFLLYVGGYDTRKNIPMLMEAYQKHIANHYPIDLILVGAENHELEQFITDEYCERVAGKFPVKPKGNIILTPPMSSGELKHLYKQAKALVHPSLYEGFNLSLVESMQCGLPIIASDIPVNHEVTEDAAFFINPKSADTIGIGIHEFLNNKPLEKDLKKKSLLRGKDFSWAKCAEETLYVYNLFT